MQEAFKDHIDTNFPELRTTPFLVAVSGGVDSVVMAHLCKSAKLNFGIAHVNYGLRGEESEKDAAFVEKLAAEWGLPYYSTRFNTRSLKSTLKGSTQEIARDLRYDWFTKLLSVEKYAYVVTAHHADDDLETFLLNLSRGAGLKGLRGIPPKRDYIRRPLLNISKAEILDYARKMGLSWREDASNETDAYQRNAIRHQVIPKLKQVSPDILMAFIRSRSHLLSSSNILDNYIETIKKQVFKFNKDIIEIPLTELREFGSWSDLAFPLLEEFDFTDWEGIQGLESADSGAIIRSASHEILKDRDLLRLRPLQLDSVLEEKGLQLEVEAVKAIEATSPRTLYIDKESLKHRLNVRKWKKGDYFYPLGMGGKKKKLSKFFKDIKLDVFSKEDQWVLCDGEDIVWVIGHRADERFKVQPETDSILRITWTD